ncbi:ABC-three component system protein [Formosa sp. L2A11]|uniref:ABC-three component system protein n=1 Tax=Formosa sp. L2A11 TaxID=2686363 RepID=UPI00131A66F2|nr:ABC-three component system protein [Formosa sp. L2A11]
MTNHSAVGPALGYYYQSIYALICLFESENEDSFVSIETLDDVYHEDGDKKNLHQLKHKTTTNTKISIKNDDLWKTIKVWCDFINNNDSTDGTFTLSTVASLDDKNPLNILKSKNGDRTELEKLLLEEAKRVIDSRKLIEKENIDLLKAGKKEKKLKYESRFKGCEAFIKLGTKRTKLLKNTIINTSVFSIENAQKEVINRIKKSVQPKNHIALAELIIAWWDRESVKSLTRERTESIYLSELLEYVSKKNAELYNDGFTDDIDEQTLPELDFTHPIHLQQLNIIDASPTQKRRSFTTELKARIQRGIWIKNNLPSSAKLHKYDKNLIEEWSYQFDEISESTEEGKKEKGRNLLNWSHSESINQLQNISPNYNNPNLIRGSYQILSKEKRVGWHQDYMTLINSKNEDE